MESLPEPGVLARHWSLDPGTVFLNHGSFGACPTEVSSYRTALLAELERQPVRFLLNEYMTGLPRIIERLETFTGAQPGSIVIVPNATTGINTVLSNIELSPGDRLITTGQEYFASKNALELTAAKSGAEVVVVPIEVPAAGPGEVLDTLLGRIDDRTRLVLVDHISSPTGMIFPLRELSAELEERGIDLLVDGAHGPGMLPLELEELGVPFYIGNNHKWLCTPKSTAILYVRPDRQEDFRPSIMSHMASDFEVDMSPFQIEFSWNGTIDPTPTMSIPFTIDHMASLHPDGWEGIMNANRILAAEAAALITSRTGLQPACPPDMQGSMAAFPLRYISPNGLPHPEGVDPLQKWLMQERGIEVPVTFTEDPPGRFLRISAQLYNSLEQYDYLCDALDDAPEGLSEGP